MKVQVFDNLDKAYEAVPLHSVRVVHFRSRNLKIALARTERGFFAVAEACPHMKASFAKGFCTRFDEIVCPLHQYRFSLKTGVEQSGQGCDDVEVYAVEWNENGVWIELP
jgi:nitrite reductase/ring-hydroxylating ferredoxin subunit